MLRDIQPGPVVTALGLLLLLVAAYWTLGYLLQRSVAFPGPAMGLPRVPRPDDARQVWLTTDDGQVEAWYLPPAASSAGPPAPAGPLLIFTHGNGELIDYWPPEFDGPRSWGAGVLLVEYPGYGRSEGRPSEASITRAMTAAWEWATDTAGYPADRIVAYGRSIGAGAACVLAAERPVAALVLESGFTSVSDLAWSFGLPSFLVRDPFDNGAVVEEFDGPILLIHGERDEVIPVGHSLRLHERVPGADLHLMACGHNDCDRPWARLRRFLEEASLLPEG